MESPTTWLFPAPLCPTQGCPAAHSNIQSDLSEVGWDHEYWPSLNWPACHSWVSIWSVWSTFSPFWCTGNHWIRERPTGKLKPNLFRDVLYLWGSVVSLCGPPPLLPCLTLFPCAQVQQHASSSETDDILQEQVSFLSWQQRLHWWLLWQFRKRQ